MRLRFHQLQYVLNRLIHYLLQEIIFIGVMEVKKSNG
jgi:hypothetical protein